MAKILVGIPSVRDYPDFIASMNVFLPAINKLHTIEVLEVKNKQIDQARNIIADYFLQRDYDYLLFLDDDHSGHTVEMLDTLLKMDSLVSAIQCYARFFPYLSNLMDYSGQTDERMKYEVKYTEGINPCDLVGFGMTLIKKEVFRILPQPYFVGKDNQREDNYFCDNLVRMGVRPMGCFDYVLTHQGIDRAKGNELRELGMEEIKREVLKVHPDMNNVVLVV